ncbi:uncharacterized protein PHALS_14218 [Plasmopara halstedii]|uniref:Uncharacterized protein n=1 Tax=Plasmopara halstedii TaxID=4781 RepID=A0A0N7L6D1_PLAHL|nr:uncharacterized protein PHALS_14218 [Plasmopara halstedii]CEG43939.1 hypothetical protein PHALS_14218 [Plasmopara halstedii]|eukprot:XP_024580308.1 hypothetical protein PHALS_14218 [Plasmopara halstedii]
MFFFGYCLNTEQLKPKSYINPHMIVPSLAKNVRPHQFAEATPKLTLHVKSHFIMSQKQLLHEWEHLSKNSVLFTEALCAIYRISDYEAMGALDDAVTLH